MKIKENPFYILGASIYDDKNKIQELAEDKAFFDDDNGDLYEPAATVLTSPKKRLSAEMRWFIDCSREQEKEIVERLENQSYYAKRFSCTLAEINFNLYALSYQTLTAETILLIGTLYDRQDFEEIKNFLNTARKVSKFPPIRDVADIKSELKNIRDDIRRAIHYDVKNLSQSQYVKLAGELAEYKNSNSIVEDFFNKIYKVDMTPRLDEHFGKLIPLLKSLENNRSENNFKSLESTIVALTEILRPIHKIATVSDIVKDEYSEEIFNTLRGLSMYLHNEKNLTDKAFRIIKILSQQFDYVDDLKQTAGEDLKILEEIKAIQILKTPDKSTIKTGNTLSSSQKQNIKNSTPITSANILSLLSDLKPIYETLSKTTSISEMTFPKYELIPKYDTPHFEESKIALENIFKMLGRRMHFEKGFGFENFKVYEDFQKNYEHEIFRRINYADCTTEEKESLNLIAAAIYTRLAMGLSYAGRFDLVRKYLEVARTYAITSKDKAILSTVQKNLNDCEKILSQRNSSGCIIFIVVILTAMLIGIF